MGMYLSLKEIKKGFMAIKQMAIEAFDKKDYELTLSKIDDAVNFVQQFNWIYTDNELENILCEISRQKLTVLPDYTPNPNRVVLFDDWCTSYVLALQYIEALSIHFSEVLYCTARDIESMSYPNILEQVAKFKNVSIAVISSKLPRFERTQQILNTIINFSPSKLFLHIGYNSPIVLALYSLPEGITRYLINLADQTFWLGAKGIDYTLEFRPFGATVSLEKRGLKKEQLLFLPFYPTRDGNQFLGFPEQTKDKIIIFSGGDFYKTLDPDYTYWKLIKDLLHENPEVVFLYATKNVMGKTADFIQHFILTNHFEQSFIYIGYRNDINEVIKHCDIFMGTCPVSGSLMTQLAAINHKPILQYYLPNTYDDETEQALCYHNNLTISFTDKTAFLQEGRKLIKDKDYRKKQGDLLYQAMLKHEEFNQLFKEVVTTHQHFVKFKKIDYSIVAERWWWNEFLGFYNTTQYLIGLLGKKQTFKLIPSIAFKYYATKVLSKIKRLIKKS